MRIQVTREFAGRLTDERRIYPGVYALDDEALFGIGHYLLDNGFAVLTFDIPDSADPSELAPQTDETARVEDSEPVDYQAWTVSALKEELEARGIDVMTLEGSGANGNVLKEDLVLVLQGDDADEKE